MAPVVDVTREALVDRRERILRQLEMDESRLRELARTGTLTGEEWAAREELDAIAYLLGEDAHD